MWVEEIRTAVREVNGEMLGSNKRPEEILAKKYPNISKRDKEIILHNIHMGTSV